MAHNRAVSKEAWRLLIPDEDYVMGQILKIYGLRWEVVDWHSGYAVLEDIEAGEADSGVQ